MKLLVVLLAVVAVANGKEIVAPLTEKARSISSVVVDAIEEAKLQMPCGFPGMGIPPLAPLKTSHQQLHLEGDDMDMTCDVTNLRIDGLDDFDIVEFQISPIFSRINFKFVWNNVQLDTLYEMLLKTKMLGMPVNMKRSGTAKVAIRGLTVIGSGKYSLGIISGNLKVKEFRLFVTLDEVSSDIDGIMNHSAMSKMINEIIEEWIMLAINDNTDNIAEMTNDIVVPKVNAMIGDRSLSDLLGMIGGGSGGSDDTPTEKVECVPPTV